MALRDDLLPDMDDYRSIAGELGFRRYEVWVRRTVSQGDRPGVGSKSYIETRLTVGNGRNPKVRVLRSKDLISGKPSAKMTEYEIGPLTPAFNGGGVSSETIDPTSDSAQMVHYIIKGPGLPDEGQLCQRYDDQQDRPLRVMIRVRATGRPVPT